MEASHKAKEWRDSQCRVQPYVTVVAAANIERLDIAGAVEAMARHV